MNRLTVSPHFHRKLCFHDFLIGNYASLTSATVCMHVSARMHALYLCAHEAVHERACECVSLVSASFSFWAVSVNQHFVVLTVLQGIKSHSSKGPTDPVSFKHMYLSSRQTELQCQRIIVGIYASLYEDPGHLLLEHFRSLFVCAHVGFLHICLERGQTFEVCIDFWHMLGTDSKTSTGNEEGNIDQGSPKPKGTWARILSGSGSFCHSCACYARRPCFGQNITCLFFRFRIYTRFGVHSVLHGLLLDEERYKQKFL